ncbi:hypothetical protein PYCC9005_004930 [Savitreella phatthalungensis]
MVAIGMILSLLLHFTIVQAAQYGDTTFNPGWFQCEIDDWRPTFSGYGLLREDAPTRYFEYIRWRGGPGTKVMVTELDHDDHGRVVFGVPISGQVDGELHFYYHHARYKVIGGDGLWHLCDGFED